LLDIGDALIYEGSKISHLRHPMNGQNFQHQTFFHYVKKDGEFNFLKFDERPSLLSSKDAEMWNHPNWNDNLFKLGKVGPINNDNNSE
jgi:hypothetical protein